MLLGLFFMLNLLWPDYLYAMHISEGILPLSQALFWFLLSVVVIGLAYFYLKKSLSEFPERKALFAFATALVFLLSCLPIPVPFVGTCSHPVGVSIAVMLLGLGGGIISGFIVLLLQAFLLSHGGLSSLGANIFSMAVVGSFTAFLSLILLKRFSLSPFLIGLAMGILSDWATYLTTAFQLALALSGNTPLGSILYKALLAFLPTQIPIGLLEGLIAGGLATALAKRRKDLLIWEV